MNITKYIIILLIGLYLIKSILGSKYIKRIIKPITNKKMKNKFINLIIIYRINYFNILENNYEFSKEIYNKILSKEDLRREELVILNKYI